MPKKGKHYVKNKDLYEALVRFKETGVIGDDLHLMFYKMAKNTGTKPRFSGYPWIEDMTSDAYLKCCVKAHKFNLERKNPFGYFSTVIIHHFWDALGVEDRQKNIKSKIRDVQTSEIYQRYGITFKVGERHSE
jgi:DNA-directed RNA polymerase specialized sigma24 family protein